MSRSNGSTSSAYAAFRLGELFDERRENGRAGLPTLSITMDGAFDRDSLDRRVESALLPEQHSLARKDDLAYNTMRLWQGVISRAPYDCLVSPAYVVVSPNAQIDPMFAEHLFRSEESIRKFRRYSQGVADDRLRCYFDEFSRIKVNIPPLPKQKRIAAVLSAVDGAIESNRAVQTQTRRLKQATLQSLLTHGLPGKHKRFQSDRAVGTMPADWACDTIGSVLEESLYGLSESMADSGRYPCFRMNNYRDGRMIAENLKYIDLDAKSFELYRVRRGDVLFNRTNSRDLVGKIGIFDLDGDFVFASYLVCLRVDTKRIDAEFFNLVMNTDGYQQRIQALATPGVSQSNINVENLKSLRIAIPPLPEQRAIVSATSAIDTRLSATTAALSALTKLKAALSQELLTGGTTCRAK